MVITQFQIVRGRRAGELFVNHFLIRSLHVCAKKVLNIPNSNKPKMQGKMRWNVVMAVGVMIALVGVMAVGVMAVGVMAVGVMAVGVMAVGVMAVGVMAVGVMAVGVMAATYLIAKTVCSYCTVPKRSFLR
jgi:hypothetical protein